MLFTLPRAPYLPPFWDYQSPDRHISLPSLCSESVPTQGFLWSASHSSCSQELKCDLAGRYRHPALPKASCSALKHQCLGAHLSLSSPWEPVPSTLTLLLTTSLPAGPAHPWCTWILLLCQLGNREVLGCLSSLGSRCWQHAGFEHCGDRGAAQTDPPRGPVALLWATTTLLCHPEGSIGAAHPGRDRVCLLKGVQ